MFFSFHRRLAAGVGLLGAVSTAYLIWRNRKRLAVIHHALAEALVISIVAILAITLGLYLAVGTSLFKPVSKFDIATEMLTAVALLAICTLPMLISALSVSLPETAYKTFQQSPEISEPVIADRSSDASSNSTPAKATGRAFGKAVKWTVRKARRAQKNVERTVSEISAGVNETLPKAPAIPPKFQWGSTLPLLMLIGATSIATLSASTALAMFAVALAIVGFVGLFVRTGAVVLAASFLFATVFGVQYGIELVGRAPDATVLLEKDVAPLRGTIAANSFAGLLLVGEDKRFLLLPWSRVSSIQYDVGKPPLETLAILAKKLMPSPVTVTLK